MRQATMNVSRTIRVALWGALCLAGGGLGPLATEASAARLGAAAELVGPWEISLVDSPRRCGMVLRDDRAAGEEHSLALPAGCRRALPVLKDVTGWELAGEDALVLDGRDGKPVLDFVAGPDNKLVAKGPEGESYEIVATGRQQFAQARESSGIQAAPRAGGPATVTPGTRAPTPAAASKAPATAPAKPAPAAPTAEGTSAAITRYPGRISDLGGRYVILRAGQEGGRDIGCMLTLDEGSRGPGGFRAQLAPACRDNGIVVFEPVGWHFANGRLVLTARKGHSAMFDYHADGSWWKDPKEAGKPLGLRHM